MENMDISGFLLKIRTRKDKVRLLKNTVYVLKMCIWTRPPGKILIDRPTRKCLKQSKKGISLL